MFESEMRASGSWPFSSPAILSFTFTSWLGKNRSAIERNLRVTPRFTKRGRAFNAVEEATPWLRAHSIEPETVVFGTYEDPVLASHAGATVLVGMGKNSAGEDVGFGLEVIPGAGVVASKVFVRCGIATWHRLASMDARASGRSLLDVLGTADSESTGDSDMRRDIPAESIGRAATGASAYAGWRLRGNVSVTTPEPKDEDVPLYSFLRPGTVVGHFEGTTPVGKSRWCFCADGEFRDLEYGVKYPRGSYVLEAQPSPSVVVNDPNVGVRRIPSDKISGFERYTSTISRQQR